MSVPYGNLVAALGKDWGDPKVDQLVSELGILSQLEHIEQLAFASSRAAGVSLAFKNKEYIESGGQRYSDKGPVSLIGIHLYSEGSEGYRQYQGELPFGLSLNDERDTVRRRVGQAPESGGGNKALGRIWPHWDRFALGEHSLRIQYRGDGRVDVVTLIPLSEAHN